MAEFAYEKPFQIGADDATYDLVTSEHVSTVEAATSTWPPFGPMTCA